MTTASSPVPLKTRSSLLPLAAKSLYALALATAISTWLIAIRTPLWLDETISFWQIDGGVAHILSRQGGLSALAVPAYPYILWFFIKILGTSEIALRVPSVLAMLGALYLLYRAASELLDRELATVAVIIFSLHPVVVFAAVDARPYAFAALAINATIYLLVRLRHSDSRWLAAAFGAMAAVIVWFQFLFGVILPALAIGFFAVKLGGKKSREGHAAMWPQFGVALVAFAIAFLPVVPGVLYMFRSRGIHPFDVAPRFMDLLWTLTPGSLPKILGATALAAVLAALWSMPASKSHQHSGRTLRMLAAVLAALLVFATLRLENAMVPMNFRILLTLAACLVVALAAWLSRRLGLRSYFQIWRVLLCALLGLMPILVLYLVSKDTPLHIFVDRYRIVAVPGIALTWALIMCGVRFRVLQAAFCITIAVLAAYDAFTSPQSRHHGYTWKYALENAEKNAAGDHATVLICSDLPESDHMTIPASHEVKDSGLFSELSYYKLMVPVVGLPRGLTPDAVRVGSAFLQLATKSHARFLAMGYVPSSRTLEWLKRSAQADYSVRELGSYDNVRVVEFDPKK